MSLQVVLAITIDVCKPFVEATYLAQANEVDRGIDPLKWCKDHSTTLPAWASAAKQLQVVLIQHSATNVERFSPY